MVEMDGVEGATCFSTSCANRAGTTQSGAAP